MGKRLKRRTPDLRALVDKLPNNGIMMLLFETPSGLAIFSFSELHYYVPHTLKNIWAKFGDENRAQFEVFLEEFQTFEDKSSAINAVTGVNRQLADMIKRWCNVPGMKLGVGKPEYKTIIESELMRQISCMHDGIVMEVMWGIQHLIRELVPKENSELSKEDRLPMSQGLKRFLNRYGFDIEPDMVSKQIVLAACALFEGNAVYKRYLRGLRDIGLFFKNISGINCEHWDALQLVSALKLLLFPEEEINFPEVFAQYELSKLKGDAPKYKGILPDCTCLRIYMEIVEAHRVRIENKKLLESLFKEAKEAHEAEHAEVQESEHIQQEHVFFANLCRMILPVIYTSKPYTPELPLQKVLKRPWDSAFEPVVVNKSIFHEGSALGEIVNRRIARRLIFFWSSAFDFQSHGAI